MPSSRLVALPVRPIRRESIREREEVLPAGIFLEGAGSAKMARVLSRRGGKGQEAPRDEIRRAARADRLPARTAPAR
jgi:hypothetical protein